MNLTNTLLSALSITVAAGSAQTLNIRLFDYANLPAEEIARTAEITSLAFAHSGIQVAWLQCRGAAVPAQPALACDTEMGAHDITMRLLPLALDDKDPRTTEMGRAFVNAQGGHYATIYVPAVRATAESLGVGADLLLGYVIAHEGVHCMLGPAHSRFGLMRAGYGRKDAGDLERVSLGPPRPRRTSSPPSSRRPRPWRRNTDGRGPEFDAVTPVVQKRLSSQLTGSS